jgi:hypothetical protein
MDLKGSGSILIGVIALHFSGGTEISIEFLSSSNLRREKREMSKWDDDFDSYFGDARFKYRMEY